MSEYQILSADATGMPIIAQMGKFNLDGQFVNTSDDSLLIFPKPFLAYGTLFVNFRDNNTIYNKALLGTIQFNKTTKVLNNPVAFVNTLSDVRPTQGRVFPIVR